MTEETDQSLNLQGKPVDVLEKEARERIAVERQKDTPQEEVKEGQPEVNTLKKRNKNRVFTLIILLFGALIVLAWVGDKAYNHFGKEKPNEEEEVKAPITGATTIRKNLGQNLNPFVVAEPEQAKGTTAQQVVAPPAPVVFNKSLAISSSSVGNVNSSTAGTKNTLSRDDEQSAAQKQAEAEQQAAAVRLAAAKGQLDNASEPDIPSQVSVSRITLNPSLYVPVDTYIPCSLKTRFVSDVAGRISCIISDDVYSADHHVRLIPAGTIARGSYKSGTLKHGQARMFIIWTELRTPTGLKIPMIDSQVVGQLGEAGIDGWIDTHFWERFGNAMLLSTVQDVAAAAAGASPSKDRNTDYTENSRAAASEMAKSALDNSINIPPTIYKNQGDVIGIMTGTDIDFSNVYQLALK